MCYYCKYHKYLVEPSSKDTSGQKKVSIQLRCFTVVPIVGYFLHTVTDAMYNRKLVWGSVHTEARATV